MAAKRNGGAGSSGPLVHLFDGHVYIFRAYYSLPPMAATDGTPCNAAYGFANTLLRYAAAEAPTHAAVCLDAAMTSFRNEIEAGYKAQRGEPPDDLEPQFDLCREIAQALGIVDGDEGMARGMGRPPGHQGEFAADACRFAHGQGQRR